MLSINALQCCASNSHYNIPDCSVQLSCTHHAQQVQPMQLFHCHLPQHCSCSDSVSNRQDIILTTPWHAYHLAACPKSGPIAKSRMHIVWARLWGLAVSSAASNTTQPCMRLQIAPSCQSGSCGNLQCHHPVQQYKNTPQPRCSWCPVASMQHSLSIATQGTLQQFCTPTTLRSMVPSAFVGLSANGTLQDLPLLS